MKKVGLSVILWMGVLLLAVSAVYSNARRQTISNDTLKDIDYGFQLTRPGDAWEFLREQTIRRFDADALAGLYHPGTKTYSVVAFEPAGERELKAYLNELARNLGLTRRRVEQVALEERDGNTIGRLRVRGYRGAELRRYLITVEPRDNLYYRVVSWWPGLADSSVAADLKRIHNDFKVTAGAEVVRKITADPHEMVGVGWEVTNNFYQNSILGLSASLPREDWRFLGSQELRELNPEAAMGMEHVEGAYLILVAEKLGDYVWQGYEKNVIDSLKEEIEFSEYRVEPVTLMNQKRSLHIFEKVEIDGDEDNSGKYDYGVIVSTAETYGYQWFAWWPRGEQETALAALRQAYGRFSYMDWGRQKDLRRSLLGFAGRPRSVRTHENFRNLTYRNYATGTILKLPRGFWEHRLDEEESPVENGEPQPSVQIENVTNGLYLTMRHEECKFRPAVYHKEVLKSLGAHTVLKNRVYGGPFGPVFATRVRPDEDKDFIYHIATVVRRNVCLQLSMHGYARNLENTYPLENQVLRGLSMSGRKFPDEKALGYEFIDYRMGYRLRKPAGWTFEQIQAVEERESSLISAAGNQLQVLAGAVQATIEPRDFPSDFSELDLLQGIELGDPTATTVQWLGQDSQRLVFRGKKGEQPVTAELLITGIGGSNFFLLAVGEGEITIPRYLKNGYRLMP